MDLRTMLFRKRYPCTFDGLGELASDLSSADPKLQRHALAALRKDRVVRQCVLLLTLAFQAADEQRTAGTFEGDSVQVETWRPVAGILGRLQDLRTMSNAQSRDAASALELLQAERRSLTKSPRPAPQN